MKLSKAHIVKLKELCNIYNVDKMYLFGSAVTDNFDDQSDVDFLVKFKPIDLSKYFENYINFKESLKNLLKRDVDLLEEQSIKNPILKKSIDKSKALIYG